MPEHTPGGMVRIIVRLFKIDEKGNVFCGQCLGYGHGGKIQHIPTGEDAAIDAYLADHGDIPCFACHKLPSEWPISGMLQPLYDAAIRKATGED